MFKALLLLLGGLMYAGFSVKSLMDTRALEERGVTAVVQPIDEYRQKTNKKNNNVEYDAEISFVTESGQVITARKRLTIDLLNQFARNQPVSIRYLPDKPSVSRLGSEGTTTGVDVGLGLVVFAIGIFWFRRQLYAPAQPN